MIRHTQHVLSKLLIATVILGFSSCHPENSKSEAGDDVFQSICIDINTPSVDISDLIDKVEVVKLEETEQSLIGAAMEVYWNGSYFKFTSEKLKTLYVFNRFGDLVTKFNRFGNGPEEYGSINSYWLRSDTLVFFDNSRKRLFKYLLDGQYLSSMETVYDVNHVQELNGKYWLDLSFRAQADSSAGQIAMLDKSFGNPRYFLETLGDIGFPTGTPVNSFTPYKNSLLYRQLLSDSVYQINDERVRPYLHFDLKGEFLWILVEAKDEQTSPVNQILTSGKVWLFVPKIGEEWIHIDYRIGFDQAYDDLLYHRPTGQITSIDTKKGDQSSYDLAFNSWHNGRMLLTVNSSDIGEFLAELDENQISFIEGSTLEDIESSENPALMWVKFKSEF